MCCPRQAVSERETYQHLVDLVSIREGELEVKVDQDAAACVEVRLRAIRQLERAAPRSPIPADVAAPGRKCSLPPAHRRQRDEVFVIRLDQKVESFIHEEVEPLLVEKVGRYGSVVVLVKDRKVVDWYYLVHGR